MRAIRSECAFGGFPRVDGTIAFYVRVGALVSSSSVVLDVGCGRGKWLEDPVTTRAQIRLLRGRVSRVIGIDVDPIGAKNRSIDEFKRILDEHWPIQSESIDLVIADCVLEHVSSPELFFSEAKRVLRHGGHLAIRTANRLGYVGILSDCIPNHYHAKLLQVSQGRSHADVFPTLYRCNTVWSIRKAMRCFGLDHAVYGFDAEPSYLAFSKWAFRLGLLYQRLMPECLSNAIFAFARKRVDGTAPRRME